MEINNKIDHKWTCFVFQFKNSQILKLNRKKFGVRHGKVDEFQKKKICPTTRLRLMCELPGCFWMTTKLDECAKQNGELPGKCMETQYKASQQFSCRVSIFYRQLSSFFNWLIYHVHHTFFLAIITFPDCSHIFRWKLRSFSYLKVPIFLTIFSDAQHGAAAIFLYIFLGRKQCFLSHPAKCCGPLASFSMCSVLNT